ncbi:MAG: hypothetical protein AAF625_13030 [Pseudomonadota bacterium]
MADDDDDKDVSTDFKTAATLVGKPTVESGFELLFGKVDVRLRGIAAPDNDAGEGKNEPGGQASAEHLESLLANVDEVTCFLDGTLAGDDNGEPVGICVIASGDGAETAVQDLGSLQVAAGHALDCPRYSGGMYKTQEASAKANGNDLTTVYALPHHCKPR